MVKHFETQREYLASLNPPLAKAGARGKFSKVAHEALAEASAKGITFGPIAVESKSEDSDSLGKSKAPVAKVAGASPSDIRAWALAQGMEVSVRGRISREVIDAYNGNPLTTKPEQNGWTANPVPRQLKVRPPTTYYGLTEEGYRVGWSTCRGCKQSSIYCSCEGGPRPPSIVVQVLDLTSTG